MNWDMITKHVGPERSRMKLSGKYRFGLAFPLLPLDLVMHVFKAMGMFLQSRRNWHCGLVCLASASLLLISGCIGGSVPQEQILRIVQEIPVTSTTNGLSKDASITQGRSDFSGPLIVMENLDSFPALDRAAVMLAQGNVLTPSTRWYWEGSPAAIASASIAASLQKERSYTVVWPMRNRLEHQAMLTGRVEIFEASPTGKTMRIGLRMSLWTPRGGKLLLTRLVQATQPLSSVSAEGIAMAASQCMTDITADIAAWLRTEGATAIAAAR